MPALADIDLIRAWERGAEAGAARRALELLALTTPDQPLESLVQMPLGVRDGRLMGLHEALFGARADVTAECPACGQAIEAEVDLRSLRSSAPGQTAQSQAVVADHRISWRAINTEDLGVIVHEPSVEVASRRLAERLILQAVAPSGEPVAPMDLPQSVIEGFAEAAAAADPLADVQISLQCPTCDHRWSAGFDIGMQLWSQLQAWIHRTLGDVHLLARAYGWSEAEILAMPPVRRSFYLELCQS